MFFPKRPDIELHNMAPVDLEHLPRDMAPVDLEHLPRDLWYNCISENLSPADLARLSLVSRRFRDVLRDEDGKNRIFFSKNKVAYSPPILGVATTIVRTFRGIADRLGVAKNNLFPYQVAIYRIAKQINDTLSAGNDFSTLTASQLLPNILCNSIIGGEYDRILNHMIEQEQIGSIKKEADLNKLIEILKAPNDLTFLQLEDFYMHAEGVEALATALSSPNCHLISLNLIHMHIENLGVLAGALSSPDCHLISLDLSHNEDLSHNDISNGGAQALAGALVSPNCHLISLNLSYNYIPDGGAQALAGALVSPDCHLISLNLSHTYISNEGTQALATALSSPNCHLISLNLSHNDISNGGAQALAGALRSPNCHLISLNLSSCNNMTSCTHVGNQGILALAGALRSPNCRLTSLNISYTRMGDSGAQALAGALSSPHCHLTSLYLSQNYISHEGIKALVAAWRDPNCRLSEVIFHNNVINCKEERLKNSCKSRHSNFCTIL